ncbi:MAG: inositol monophosphatase family protein [Gammaproteobacteria bacterium]
MPQQSYILATAADAVRQAGLLVRRRFYSPRDVVVKQKTGGELVTETDRDAEDIIREAIAQTFPEHGFLGEESGMHGDDNACWVADPLDGTTNFVHGFEGCAVSLAFCRGGRPVAAAVFDIFADACYTAEEGAGAFCEGRRLRVSNRPALSQSLLIASGQMVCDGFSLWPMLGRLGPSLRGVRRTGSTALDLAYIAAGRAEAALSGPVRFWDVAAGWLLVREAGGLICDINGAPEFAFGKPVPPFAAGNAKTFRHFLRELQTCAAEE